MVATKADRVAAKLAGATTKIVAAFHADRYRIVRDTLIDDGRGGKTKVPMYLESGNRCKFNIENTRGFEGARAGVNVTSTSSYSAQLPLSSVVEAKDILEVSANGDAPWRPFNVVAVKRDGQIALQVLTVELEERS